MIYKINRIFLYCLFAIIFQFVSAMDYDETDEDPGGYRVEPSLLVVEVTDPQLQYQMGREILDSLPTVPSELHQSKLRIAVNLLTLSARGNCELAKEILPIWQYNLGVSLFNSADSLALNERISRLKDVRGLFILSTKGGDDHAKRDLPLINYHLGCALYDSIKQNVASRQEISLLRRIIKLLNASVETKKRDAETLLKEVRFSLACQLIKSTEGLNPDQRLPVAREAIDLLQTRQDSQMELGYAYYILAVALQAVSKKTPAKELSLFEEAVDFLSKSAERQNKHAKKALPSWQQLLAAKLANSVDQQPLEQRTPILRTVVDLLNKSSSVNPIYRSNFHIAQHNLGAHLIELSLKLQSAERNVLLIEAKDIINGCIAEGNKDTNFTYLLGIIDKLLNPQ